MWRNRSAFRRNFPELVDELFARQRVAAVPARLRRRLDLARRKPVRRLAGNRPLPHVHLRRARALRGRELPHAPRGRAPRDRGQVERRLRRDGRTRCCGPTSSADWPRTPATRSSRCATCPSSATSVRALRDHYDGLVRALLGGLPQPARALEGQRPHAPERLLHGRLLLGRRGRHRAAALRHGHRRAAARDLGALARLGPGADGARARRRAALAEGDLHRLPASATSSSSTWARRRSGASSRRSASPTTSSSSSTARTRRSSTATRRRSPTWPSGSRDRAA